MTAGEISLKEHMENRIENLEKFIDERFGAQEAAIKLARESIDERLQGMNELRAQIHNERGLYITASYFEAKHSSLENQVDVIRSSGSARDVRLATLETRIAMVGAFAIFISPLLAIAINYFIYGKL